MLNRRILRIKAFKVLYSYAENPSMTISEAEALLEESCEATRSLYLFMLDIIPYLTAEARTRIENARNKFNPSEEERNPNMKFVRNAVSPLLEQDPDFRKIVSRRKLSWEPYDALIRNVYDSICSKEYFKEYMSVPESSLEEDVRLVGEGMTRLIFDLRDNTGGYLDQALLLSDMFLRKGDEIVYMQGLHRKKDNYKADGKGLLQDIGLTVLINESTASSSEIFAGAIQDNDRGVIIGRRSFGKGLVQEPIYFSDGSGVRLTVARFYTPSGRCIQKPYSEDYQYDIYKRYADGEMYDADSIKVDSTAAYKTVAGRTVYGGGGIIPDIFVPVDTTRATKFFIACNKKATQMRFASAMFDRYKGSLTEIGDYDELNRFLDRMNLPAAFREYASSKDGISCTQKEWDETSDYLLPQLRALVGRYSRLGENAFYKMYLNVDVTLKKAIESDSRNLLHPAD